MENKDGGPAFPKTVMVLGIQDQGSDGMSLRDWFAGQALAGYLANSEPQAIKESAPVHCARIAYEFADAMLSARDAQGKP